MLMAVPLEEKFMAQLDMHSSQLIKVIRAKGGATRQKTADIMDTLDQVDLRVQSSRFSLVAKRGVTVYLYPL